MKHGNDFNRQKESSCTFQHIDVGDNNITSLFLPEFSPLLLELRVTLKTTGLIAAGAVGTCTGGRIFGIPSRSQQDTEGWE